ncbi:MAG: hypothetical protein L0Y79_10180, partial [Chlorobi bacterium]|nr:hypothetical protein [Chlorobiota bacterium]
YGNRLFSGIDDPKIDDELSNTNEYGFIYFVDEITFSQVPCIKYVQDKIDAYNQQHSTDVKLTCCVNKEFPTRNCRNVSLAYKTFIDVVKPKEFSLDNVDMIEHILPSGVFSELDYRIPTSGPTSWLKSKEFYNESIQKRLFGDRNSISTSQQWLNFTEDERWVNPQPEGSIVYMIEEARDQIEEYSPGTKLIVQPQLQLFQGIDDGKFTGGTREPFNEEIEAQVGVSLAHGAESFFWFMYQSLEWAAPPIDSFALIGLLEINSSEPRMLNCYNQNKWSFVSALNAKILRWKPTLDAVEWISGWSVHSEGANHEYISDILSIDPHQTGWNPECYLDGSTWYDCTDQRFWELGFFTNSSGERYFMFVNRRCVPQTQSNTGDNRILKIKFDANDLPTYATWKITEVGNASIGSEVYFNKNCNCYVDLGSTNGGMGWFKPGEGKLFKLTPVMKGGGTLLADEVIYNQTFTCEDTVLNNGYNITISGNSTVSFTDSATIIMSGGTFRSGTDSAGPTSNKNTFKAAVSGHKWNGLKFNDCNVKIYNSSFQDIASPTGGGFAVNSIDCPLNDIRFNTFTSSTDTAGGVNILYVDISSLLIDSYVMYNTFTMNSSSLKKGNAES